MLSAQNDYPLVAAEVSNPECLEGFLDLPTLLVKAFLLSGAITADVTYTEATQRLFPELSLPCSGAILGWTLAALNAGGSKSKYPELQVWRNSGGSSYYKVSTATTEYKNSLIVYLIWSAINFCLVYMNFDWPLVRMYI